MMGTRGGRRSQDVGARPKGRGARPFETLLHRLIQAPLDRRAERRFVGLHLHHFRQRVRVLDPAFFPGQERSEDAIASLGHGAYVDFAQAPDFEGRPAFEHADRAALPPLSFLYYWRASATICFLRKNASGALHTRLNMMRNVRIHLREGFEQVESRLGERRWALPEWSPSTKASTPLSNTRGLQVELSGRRGKAAVRTVLSAAGVPLTRSQIAEVLLRSGFLASPDVAFDARDAASTSPDAVEVLAASEVQTRVDAFFAALTAEDVALLRARGYTQNGRPRVPFPEVARTMGRLTAESWRLKERRVLEVFREHFEPNDAPAAVAHLIHLLDG